MSHKALHDIAKFGAGLVTADLLFLLWIAMADILPMEFLGRTITESVVAPGIVFDVALLFILIHYGWNIGKIPALRERSYLILAGLIFTGVAIVHMARIFTGAAFVIHDWEAPIWLSWVGTVVTVYLAYMSYRFALRTRD